MAMMAVDMATHLGTVTKRSVTLSASAKPVSFCQGPCLYFVGLALMHCKIKQEHISRSVAKRDNDSFDKTGKNGNAVQIWLP